MRAQRLYGKSARGQQPPENCVRRPLLAGLVALLLLFVQATHPGLHPHEIIGAGADVSQVCPLSHVTVDLEILLTLLLLLAVALRQVLAPQPWVDHPDFLHPLAPRPPPTSLA